MMVRYIVLGDGVDEELDEEALMLAMREHGEVAAWLCGQRTLEGALMIGEAKLFDDLTSAVQRLCFDALQVLSQSGARYEYRYFTSGANATLETSSDGSSITLSGELEEVPKQQLPREELLRALYACGVRYIALLEELGQRGRESSKYQLEQLRPYAESARAVVTARGLA